MATNSRGIVDKVKRAKKSGKNGRSYPAISTEKPQRMGAPSKYTEELADTICERLAAGESLARICKDKNMPNKETVVNWAITNRNNFFMKYAQARHEQLWLYADEMLDIADNAGDHVGPGDFTVSPKTGRIIVNHDAIQRAKLKIDTRKWLLAKLLPAQFGEHRREIIEQRGEVTVTIKDMTTSQDVKDKLSEKVINHK